MRRNGKSFLKFRAADQYIFAAYPGYLSALVCFIVRSWSKKKKFVVKLYKVKI